MSAQADHDIASKWALHWTVWNNDHKTLSRLLEQKMYDIELKDPRGRTPLHLAVALGFKECVDVLLHYKASALALNRHQWSVFQEAICTGNPDLVNVVAMAKDSEQSSKTAREIPLLLERLQNAPDFYTEMKWEFTSWVPFLSRVCPSDTYKIWKKGTKVRVDTTLIGFENMQWIRGSQSFIFNVTGEGAQFTEVDHDKQMVWQHPISLVSKSETNPEDYMAHHGLAIVRRLSSPVASTIFDTNSIEFQRQKAGIWGFRSDRNEVVDGHDAKVFTASGLELVTRTRVDHLPEEEREKFKDGGSNPFQELLGMGEDIPMQATDGTPGGVAGGRGGVAAANMLLGSSKLINNSKLPQLSINEYFAPPNNLKEYDAIGHSVEIYNRVQSLKATVWLAEDHPLSLQDQIMPVIDLMAVNNAHFAKLKDFITLQMPAGFPVKFEIPLFHVMSARVTFGNINGLSQPAPYISLQDEVVINEQPGLPETNTCNVATTVSSALKRRHTGSSSSDGGTTSTAATHSDNWHDHTNPTKRNRRCLINDETFEVPKDYRNPRHQQRVTTLADEEEEMLQMAIRQSLLDYNNPTEPQNTAVVDRHSHQEPLMLMDALKDDSIMSHVNTSRGSTLPSQLTPYMVVPTSVVEDDDFALALELSKAQAREDEERRERQRQEDEELERVLKLSLTEK